MLPSFSISEFSLPGGSDVLQKLLLLSEKRSASFMLQGQLVEEGPFFVVIFDGLGSIGLGLIGLA